MRRLFRFRYTQINCAEDIERRNTLLRVLSRKRGDNLGFGAMSRPDFIAGSMLPGKSAFVPQADLNHKPISSAFSCFAGVAKRRD